MSTCRCELQRGCELNHLINQLIFDEFERGVGVKQQRYGPKQIPKFAFILIAGEGRHVKRMREGWWWGFRQRRGFKLLTPVEM